MNEQYEDRTTENRRSSFRKWRRLGYAVLRRAQLVSRALFCGDKSVRRALRELRWTASEQQSKPRNILLQNPADQEIYDLTMQLLGDANLPAHHNGASVSSNGVDVSSPEELKSLVERIAREKLVSGEGVSGDRPAELVSITHELVDVGGQISERASANLRVARADSEDAVLRIGSEISEFYKIAKQTNEAINSSLQIAVDSGSVSKNASGKSQLCVTEMIRKQQVNMSSFLSQVIAYFERQTELAGQSKTSFQDVQNCVKQVERIVRSAQVLAVNVQVESARLGEKGRAFSILGSKMKTFSEQVEQANESIQSAVGDVVGVMTDFESEALEIDSQLHGYVAQFSSDLAEVESRANELKTSMVDTLEMVNSCNQGLIERSQNALSALQFQDPLVKNLQQIEEDIQQLNGIVQTGKCESLDTSSNMEEELSAVGPASGEVELF